MHRVAFAFLASASLYAQVHTHTPRNDAMFRACSAAAACRAPRSRSRGSSVEAGNNAELLNGFRKWTGCVR